MLNMLTYPIQVLNFRFCDKYVQEQDAMELDGNSNYNEKSLNIDLEFQVLHMCSHLFLESKVKEIN